ncbi:hypothetical protein [Pseudomonas amygdali]|uniref:hypothetical protein n=1 Tax=Pseudomonas amygdali TaxID=47877 RepID=UPI00345484FD
MKLATKADIAAQAQREVGSQQLGGAYKFSHNNEYMCTFSLNNPVENRLQNRTYANEYNDPVKGILFAQNVSNFYVAAHELSHCFNHNRLPTGKPLVRMMVNPDFAELVTPVGMLEHSILESYADLSVVMLGASKTGDWTVFTDAVMRARSGLPDPMHLTSNAVSSIIAGIDPKSLKGLSFREINAMVNQEFRKNFLDGRGEIGMGSPGVVRIMQEMNFLGERLKGVASLPGVPAQSAQQLRAQAEVIDKFSAKVYNKLPVDVNDYAFLTALQIVDARQQQKLASASVPASLAGKNLIKQIVQGMDERQNVSTYLYSTMTHNERQADNVLQRKVGVVEKWVMDSRSDVSANLLNEDIRQMIARYTTLSSDQMLTADTGTALRKPGKSYEPSSLSR